MDKTYTVSIASDSAVIKGSETVAINQAANDSDTRATLTAGSAVPVAASDITANVTFTGAGSLSLSNADFAVDNNATITNVNVATGTAKVTVTFAANESTTASKTYTVSIASTSSVIKGTTTVVITQAAATSETRKTLSAGPAVPALSTATTANVTFTGATGLSLSNADFAVSSGGTISNVSVDSGTATVTATFLPNASTTPKTYTVSIASGSTKIKGTGTVAINQAAATTDTRPTLTAGSAVSVAASATTANVTFTGATGLTLTTADFEVTSGGTISNVSVDSNTATVTATFPANASTMDKTYTVSIASDSAVIKGTGTVAINQVAAATDTRATLTAGSPVSVAASDTTANVSFNDATDPLTTADFEVDNNATITSVTVDSSTATVTVTFTPNTSTTESKTYIVSIASDSAVIKGSETVAINQAANDSDTRATLTPVLTVEEVESYCTFTSVYFTGAAGLSLSTADFEVDNNATITSVTLVAFDTAMVSVTLPINTSTTEPKTYIVSIVSGSTEIKGDGTVTITQVGDTRPTLTPGPPVSVAASDTTANVTFTTGTTDALYLSDYDFEVDNDAEISEVSPSSGTVTVTVTFEANESATESKTYTVSIASDSWEIKGEGTVVITQADNDPRALLTPGEAVEVAASATTANVSFTGATGLGALIGTNFAVSSGGTITGANISSDTAWVTVTFAANTSIITPKTYTVSIASSSTVINGAGTVAINQTVAPLTEVDASPFTDSINSVAYSRDNKYVAVGDNGKIAHSTNTGETWTAVSGSPFTGSINGVAYGNNKYVAVGDNGKIAYSTNSGLTWMEVDASPFTDSINGVAYGNEKYVAVGDNGKIAYSTNGETWTAVGVSPFTDSLNGVTYGASNSNKYVAVGDNGKMAYSPDGMSWAEASASPFTGSINGIASDASGRFVAVGADGKMAYSTNGISWTEISASQIPFTGSINGVASNGIRFVAVGADGKIMYWNL
jgi:photosystem II stability/assembly factor-like uncharacterized protein